MKYSRVQEIFDAILDLPSEERPAALERACAGDQRLRHEIESLLTAHRDAGLFMGRPTEMNGTARFVSGGDEQQVDSMIGQYRLLRQIGEGGFGIVYLAQQTAPMKRRVALKVIKPGMDTRQVTARFEAERQALAMMDHPHIARVYDAGATREGRPFFVMELVNGDPITDYLNRQRASIKSRLELFLQVGQAVQHAHQKGIIHRDLKPNNILVSVADSQPVAKVIDFGIAKAIHSDLTEKTLFTEFRQFIGTPEYMSPEQVDRATADIDTRSDVYSLGVLLYEILTGSPPLEGQRLRSMSTGDLQRAICNEEPPKPSQRVATLGERLPEVARERGVEPAMLASRLRGELDWIAMKAMEKDRARRYPSAQGLVDDVERYLRDEPIEAGPTRFSYRFLKFARRHRALITTATAAIVILTLGLVGTSQGLVWALRERDRAQRAEKSAAEHVEKTRRFIALIGSPLMQPDDIHRFKKEWQQEIDRSRVTRGARNRDQIAEECRFASWLGFTSLTNDLVDLADEASIHQERVHQRARGLLAVDDPVYTSLVLARIQTIVFVQLRKQQPMHAQWIHDIEPAIAQKLLPLYEELMVGLKTYMAEDDPKYRQIHLEQAWMQFRAGEVTTAVATLESYLRWYEGSKRDADVRYQHLHQQRIELTAELLKDHADAHPDLYQRFQAIASRPAGSLAL